jgi:putative transcriptional regulator
VSKRLVAMAYLLWLAATPAMAAPPSLEPGMLLVARASLPDPRFHDAVVLVVQHGSQGTAGLILNRPSRLTLTEVLPTLPVLAGADNKLSYGGPVAPRTFMVLVKAAGTPPQPAQRVLDSVYLTGTAQLTAWLNSEPPGAVYRVFAGYVGWAPEQLAGETARGDWQVLPADRQVLFMTDLGGLWNELAHRQGLPMR